MNTDIIKDQGEELQSISKDLSEIFSDMYGKLTKVDSNGIWKSELLNGSANNFISNVTKDSTNNSNLVSNLTNVGSVLIQYSNGVASKADTEIGG